MVKLIKKQNVSKEMTFEDDKLNRKSIAENFNLIFEETSQPFVVALDSSWGTGKTQFIHMWRNLLKEKKVESVYLNLWEEDFLKDPFFSLTETLSKKFEDKNIGESSMRKELGVAAHELGKGMVNKVFGADIDIIAGKDYNTNQKNKKQKFKESLRSLADSIRVEMKFPLLVFIDELDRCRPNYAIEFLEIVKHFFDIDNIIFILGIDMDQLGHSVRSLYGGGMDAEEYLRKFIDMDYSFPEPEIEAYLDFLFSKFECGKKQGEQMVIVKEMIKKFKPHLRAVDNLFTRLNLIEKEINLSYIQASFFLSLKIFQRKKYIQLTTRKMDVDNIFNFIKYFESKRTNWGKLIFWRMINDWVLDISDSELGYLHNLQNIFSKINSAWPNIGNILSSYRDTDTGFRETKYSFDFLLGIFLEDKNVSQQKNIDIVKGIFHSKKSHLRELRELIQKIDFLEGLEFGKEDKDERKTN